MRRLSVIERAVALDRIAAEDYAPQPHEAMISIVSPGDEQARLRTSWSHLLRLEFEDFTDAHLAWLSEEHQRHLFTDDQAQQIVDWVRGLPDTVTDLIVHCAAGVSRSPGVCQGLSIVLGFPYWQEMVRPNKRVVRLICEAGID